MWRWIIKQRLRKLQLGQERRLAEPQNVDIDPEPDTGMKREDSYRSNTVSQNGGKLKESKGVNKTIKGFHMKTTWMNSTNLNIVNME